MARHQIEVFATTNDFREVMSAVEAERALHFVASGLFDTSDVQILRTLTSLEASPVPQSYLAADRHNSFAVRAVPQHKGGIKYAVDQLMNPASVVVKPGVVHSPSVLLAGQIGTVSEASESLELYKVLRASVLRRCTRIQSYWVGPEAERILDAGGRLTALLRSPRECDLKR